MNSIFDSCTPRAEVLRGELREDIFAARLKDVINKTADPVYSDARKFFENTYPTSGLKSLLTEALGRLVGDAAGKNAVIRLETGFGGGKTHNLIALYHAASGAATEQTLSTLVDEPIHPPNPSDILVAGIVGSDLDSELGISHDDDHLHAHTIWGELAYQLGGRAGYELAKSSDLKKVAPGTGLLEALVGDRPTLIMLDEIARHLRAAKAVTTESGQSNLAEQTVAFLMSLLEFAASKQRVVIVLTLASDADAFSSETDYVRQSLSEALKVSARQERVLSPTVETEIPAIVTHRLFKQIDREAAKPVFEAYSQYYTTLFEKNADLPQRCTHADYVKEMQDSYPFHPELLATLNHKVSTIPNFNQTRGALRLLALTVRFLWEQKPPNTWLIHLQHIDLSVSKIAEDLTSRLDRPKFRQVIEADITSVLPGTIAHAQEVDQPLVSSGKPAYASRVATTIFIHSLTQGIASGVDPADLMLAVVTPDAQGGGDDPGIIQRTLENLYHKAWFLEYDGHRYRFKTEPSLNKIVEDETLHVGPSKAKSEIEHRIRQIWKKGYFQPVFFPAEPAEVDDNADLPKLVVMHFDAVQIAADQSAPPDLVKKIYEYTGISESFRRFQNNVLFLVADADQVDNMVLVARRYLAIGRIVGDADRMKEFTREQSEQLKKMLEASELDVRVAITRAYKYLYYPSSDGQKTHAYLRRETLPAQDQGDVDKDQSNVVLRVLRLLNKVLTADDETLSAVYVKSRAWDQNQASMTTEDLRKAFARKIGLRILLDPGQLRKTIQNGIKTGTWLYYDSGEEFAYDGDAPPTAWQISDEALLYTPEEAHRLQLRIKGKWRPPGDGGGGIGPIPPTEICPVCKNPIDRCTCGIDVDDKTPAKLVGQGAVPQAFQQIIDQAQEYGLERISQLFIRIDGMNKQTAGDMRSLGLAIPQFGKGNFEILQSVILTFGQDPDREEFELEFQGGWDRYKRLKSISDAFAQEADELKITFRVGVEFDSGMEVVGQQFSIMRDVLTTLEIGRIQLEAVPLKELA
jgi:hypothetical protein